MRLKFCIYAFLFNFIRRSVTSNSRTDSLKFTMECPKETIPFLDTEVKFGDGTFYTDLYCKPLDSHSYMYLLYSSAHPHHCKKSISYSQFLRIRRICGNITDFNKHSLDFASYFHHSSWLVEESYIKARRMNRHILDLLKALDNAKPTKDQTILVTTFHPHDQMVPDIVTSNWDLLGDSHYTLFPHQKHVTKA